MPLLDTGRVRIFFAHIPKTGGTSVEAYLRRKGRVTMIADRQRPLPGEPVTPQHYHRELYRDQLPPGAVDASFAILRDPLARLVSEYRFRHRKRAGWYALDPRFHLGWRLVKIGRDYRLLTFAQWVEAVLDGARADPCLNDNHIRPQVDFLCKGMTLFRFEDGLAPVFDWIDAMTDGRRDARDHHAKRSTLIMPSARPCARRPCRSA